MEKGWPQAIHPLIPSSFFLFLTVNTWSPILGGHGEALRIQSDPYFKPAKARASDFTQFTWEETKPFMVTQE
jgi:hypothetical protein